MAQYPYLNDKAFLKLLDKEPHREQYIRIMVLDFKTEKTLASIEGKSTAGSCNFNGSSSMRRTASCTIIADPSRIEVNEEHNSRQYYNMIEVRKLISMNKKVRIETGFVNSLANLNYYSEYDIIWFPLGVYVIKAANVSKSNSGINISLTLNDKCALLNGDMGGTIPAATVFSETELFNAAGTTREVEKILIKDMIKYLVVEFGGERPDNVIITDIEDYIVKIMKWSGRGKVYLDIRKGKKTLSLSKPDGGTENEDWFVYEYGDDVGYVNEPFVYPGTLECSAGESVSSVLDKIKNVLGNFEWFYDLDGRFVFQEIKNYLNSSITQDIVDEAQTAIKEADYLSVTNYSKSVYAFDRNNKNIITSISSSPQFQNIKNDYIVWGTTKTATGANKPIRYHLAFDKKPDGWENKERFCLVYEDYKGLQQTLVLLEGTNFMWGTSNMNNTDMYYLYTDSAQQKISPFHWDSELNIYREYPEWTVCLLTPNDWRTELYFQGIEASDKTFSKNYYAAELNAEWPKIYDVKKTFNGTVEIFPNIYVPKYTGGFRDDVSKANYEYWLDFLEGSQGGSESISQFSVNNIGRRSKIVTDNNSNCIFPATPPNYVLVEADGNTSEDIAIATAKNQEVIQVSPEVFKDLVLGGSKNAAYDKIKELLYQFTSYNESITLSVIPIYYLEPNTRITVFDNETGIHGDYLIKTISLPLTTNGTSNISATRCLEKTF